MSLTAGPGDTTVKHLCWAFVLLASAGLGRAADEVPAQATLVLTSVTVIDGTGAPAQADRTVVVRDGRIAAVGAAGEIEVPKGAVVVDGKGKFLIPGLWDMHVHWYESGGLPLFVANGVTGVRVMFGNPLHLGWRKEIAAGKQVGPRMVVASPIVDGPKPIWPGSIAVTTEEDGRKAVRKVKEDGYDFVKVYSLLPREGYLAIADEARKQGIPFAGHVPSTVTVAEASAAGQKSIEHLTGIALSCADDEAALRKEMAAATGYDPTLFRRVTFKAVAGFNPKKAQALFAAFVKNGTTQVPTLTVLRALGHLDDPDFLNDPRMQYMSPFTKAFWDPKKDGRFKTMTKEDYVGQQKLFKTYQKLIGAMKGAGVEVLAGTDCLNPYCFPGFSLHDELALLVEAGLTPMEALQAATRNAARYLGLADELGTIAKGKQADLVLLDADPLADVKNTTKIRAVVQDGRLYPREKLQEMLDKVAQSNKPKKKD
jgi:imidazolonepropionase-like amidohydrolase